MHMHTLRRFLLYQTSTRSEDLLRQRGAQLPGGYPGMEDSSHRQYRQPGYATEHGYSALHQYTSYGPSPESKCRPLRASIMPRECC